MKKTIRNIFLVLVLFSSVTVAQENRFTAKLDEMRGKKWLFLVKKANLTTKETEQVEPIFMEYEKSIWSFHAKNGVFFKSIKTQLNDATINYSEINDRYAEMELTQAQLFKSYHLKLRKILAPETLFNYYRAEREYKRELLQNLKNRPITGKQSNNQELE